MCGSKTRGVMTDYDVDDDELRSELDDFAAPQKQSGRSQKEERIIAGFEEIQRFVELHGRPPQHGENRDIFERLYAVRLDRLRELQECRTVLEPFDHQGLLSAKDAIQDDDVEALDDDRLFAELAEVGTETCDISKLQHVKSSAERQAAEEIACRQKCSDFKKFEPLFRQVQKELDTGVRTTRRFERKSEIEKGRYYIVGGQKAYVAEMDKAVANQHGFLDARLRVIFDNGTESNMLMRSLQKALQQDPAGRRIIEPIAGPLFADRNVDGDDASGTIYVLRSRSDHPLVAQHRDVVHKLGVTGDSVERRIANAKLDPTFLMADVEIVATYDLYNINRTKLEHLLHRVFEPARLDIQIMDRFGNPVVPREWFLVPLFVIDDAVDKIKNGTIGQYIYDPNSAKLMTH
ncbi:conserved hypothetical protein [Azospirillaceae bacterium]